jgi:TusA-related sulfurtransferase
MKELIELDCIGMRHPLPIEKIAGIACKSTGSTLKVVADDFTFENDIKEWIENSNANLLKLEKDGCLIKVQILFEG